MVRRDRKVDARRPTCSLALVKRRRGTELLGLYSGTFRTKKSYTQVKYAPDLIFVFRGPILRCSKGDLRAEVKRVLWQAVARWLGYETEEQVKALGL